MKVKNAVLGAIVLLSLMLAGPGAYAFEHKAEDHQGPFVQAGMLGAIDLDIGDNIRLFDMGPGAFVGVGYNFGLFGLRTNFHYAQMDGKKSNAITSLIDSDLYGGSLELKLMPLGQSDIPFQPYLVAGAGAHYLDINLGGASGGDWGFAGNGGVGFDFFLVDGFALTLETNIRPTVFYSSNVPPGFNNSSDMYIYDFMGGLTYVFGAKAKEKPVAEAAPVPVAQPEKVYRTGEKIDLKGRINFKNDSSEILASSLPVLDDAANKMLAHPEIGLVEIEGHTDSVGADAYNQALSQRRADAVKDYFTQKGVAANRLTTKGYGEAQPVASNDTNDGRAENRRIIFRVVEFKNQ